MTRDLLSVLYMETWIVSTVSNMSCNSTVLCFKTLYDSALISNGQISSWRFLRLCSWVITLHLAWTKFSIFFFHRLTLIFHPQNILSSESSLTFCPISFQQKVSWCFNIMSSCLSSLYLGLVSQLLWGPVPLFSLRYTHSLLFLLPSPSLCLYFLTYCFICVFVSLQNYHQKSLQFFKRLDTFKKSYKCSEEFILYFFFKTTFSFFKY